MESDVYMVGYLIILRSLRISGFRSHPVCCPRMEALQVLGESIPWEVALTHPYNKHQLTDDVAVPETE